jgi:hypothetical protein
VRAVPANPNACSYYGEPDTTGQSIAIALNAAQHRLPANGVQCGGIRLSVMEPTVNRLEPARER